MAKFLLAMSFTIFLQQALDRQPELRALSWNPRVPDGQRAAWERDARREGLAGYEFRELDRNGHLVTAAHRSNMFPFILLNRWPATRPPWVTWCVRPGAGCLGGERARYRAAHRHSPGPFGAGTGSPAGLLVLLPVYDGPPPANVQERRQRLAGFAVAVFRVADLAGTALRNLESRGIHARLFDGSHVWRADLRRRSSGSGSGVRPGVAEAEVLMAGRRWVVQFAPTPAFEAAQPHEQSRFVLIGGPSSASVLIVGHLDGGWRRNRETVAANALLHEEVVVRKQAEAAAEEASHAKSDFLASMSHEIRTPLNAILGYTQLMQHDKGSPPEHRDAVAAISGSGRHLLGLINEILDLSKIEAGRMELHHSDFEIVGPGSQLDRHLSAALRQKRIGLRCINDGNTAAVRGDEGKLRQVLINLLANAVKFTSVG